MKLDFENLEYAEKVFVTFFENKKKVQILANVKKVFFAKKEVEFETENFNYILNFNEILCIKRILSSKEKCKILLPGLPLLLGVIFWILATFFYTLKDDTISFYIFWDFFMIFLFVVPLIFYIYTAYFCKKWNILHKFFFMILSLYSLYSIFSFILLPFDAIFMIPSCVKGSNFSCEYFSWKLATFGYWYS